jgi:hypothetical protein
MRCATCGYRQRTRLRLGDRCWVQFQGRYYAAEVDVTQGPTTDYADLYLVAVFQVKADAEPLRVLLPEDGGPWVLPWGPPPQTCEPPDPAAALPLPVPCGQ